MRNIIFSTGLRINLDNIVSISVANTTITFKDVANQTHTFSALNIQKTLFQLDSAADSSNTNTNVIIDDPGYQQFLSYTPASGIAGVDVDVTILGTKFNSFGATNIKADDGVNAYDSYFTLIDDNTIIAGFNGAGHQITVASSYPLYYSKDAGVTWINTNLTSLVMA